MEPIKIMGVYNELYYYIDKIVDNIPETIFKAGNSPYESQGYLSADEGIGLEKMKQNCENTAKDYASELNAQFIGVQYEDWGPGEDNINEIA